MANYSAPARGASPAVLNQAPIITDAGETFTVYSIDPSDRTRVNRSTILMKYEPPSAAARLGSFVWSTQASARQSPKLLPEPVNVLPVASISDVFLGMQSEAFRLLASQISTDNSRPAPVEDHCFSLVSRGSSLDLEGATIESTKAWLKQLSAIINSSGKDIVLAAEAPTPSNGSTPAPAAPASPSNAAAAASAAATSNGTAVAAPASPVAASNGKVTADASKQDGATVVAAPKAVAPAKTSPAAAAAAVAPAETAHQQMVEGSGFPFTFHYLSAEGQKLQKTPVAMNFVKATATVPAAFVLRATDASAPKPNVATSVNKDKQWEARIEFDSLADVYLGVTKGLFASQPALAGMESGRCVSLGTEEPTAIWDLEAASVPAFVEWLSAFNNILQSNEQEVAIEKVAPAGPSATPAAAAAAVVASPAKAESKPVTAAAAATPAPTSATPAAVSTPAPVASSKSLDAMRQGGYFYLYSEGSTTKKLIFLFFNDDAARALHFTEVQLSLEQNMNSNNLSATESNFLRSSLFYRYVAAIEDSASVSADKLKDRTTPKQTDECIPIFHISDFLLGKQTPLMCHHPLLTFVPNHTCFSLVLNRMNYSAAKEETVELGLECLEAKQMATWLEGIMEVSNRSAEPENAPLQPPAPMIVAPVTPVKAATNSSAAAAAQDKLLSIEHVISSPRVQQLSTLDPQVVALKKGQVFASWENYEAPERRFIIFFYDANAPAPVAAAPAAASSKSNGGAFYWNYLSINDFSEYKESEDDYSRNNHRCLQLASLQSVYHGRVSAIFQPKSGGEKTSTGLDLPIADRIISLLATDDLLNLEAESSNAQATFIASLKHVLQLSCAKNLIKVDYENEKKPTGSSSAANPEFEVSEWFNIQEAVFPVNLVSPAKPVATPAPAVAATPLPSPTAGGTSKTFSPLSPRSNEAALVSFIKGQRFNRWMQVGGQISVQPITLFVQQTPTDNVIFFVWVNGTGGAHASDAEVEKAKVWSRSLNTARDFTAAKGKPNTFPSLAISSVSDLHIGKNLPIFTQSPQGQSLIADECVSIVAAPDVPAANATTEELHLVATNGIAQIASTISAVTTLLEKDEIRLEDPLWAAMRGSSGASEEGVSKKLDFSDALPKSAAAAANASNVAAASSSSAAAPAASAPASTPSSDLLTPLRNGSTFWSWSFTSATDAAAASRAVQRVQILLKWTAGAATSPADLGVLSWEVVGQKGKGGSLPAGNISDIYVGAEAAPFTPGHSLTSIAENGTKGAAEKKTVGDENCFSIISAGATPASNLELNLESDDAALIGAWVDGLSLLLQSGGRSLTEEPVGDAAAPPAAASNAAPAAAAVAATAAVVAAAAAPELTPVTASAAPAADAVKVSIPAAAPAPAAAVAPTRPFPTIPPAPTAEDIQSLVEVLAQFIDDRTLSGYKEEQVESALAAIRDAAATQPPEVMDGSMNAGAARVVVSAMLAFPDSESIQLTGAGACWCLATTAENEALVVNAGALDINRRNLAKYPNNSMLLQQICGAIRNLTVADAHKEMFCKAGPNNEEGKAACKNLVEALQNHAPATALAQQASGSIAALAMFGPNKTLLGEAGAIPALVHAMKTHPGTDEASAAVHEECCAALRNLAANHGANKDAIAACGGIEAIVESMKTHAALAVNQLHGAGALWNIPANNVSNKAKVAACGGIETLLNAINLHPNDAEVQLECIGSLRNLSTLVENKPVLLAKGAGAVVLETMKRLADVSLLQEQSCALLFNLANYQPAGADAAKTSASSSSAVSLIKAGAVRVVLDVLTAHIQSANVVEEACAALWILQRAAPGLEWDRDVVNQVLKLAEEALSAHPNNGGVKNFATGMRSAWSVAKVKGAAAAGGAAATNAANAASDGEVLAAHDSTVVSPVRQRT